MAGTAADDPVFAAAGRVAAASVECGAVHGTLLLQAGLAAAGCGETRSVDELIAQAAEVARQIGDGPNYRQASFRAGVPRRRRLQSGGSVGGRGGPRRTG
ncbi:MULTISPECIES: hypothetical protein [unclassified Micromonospora]|uniref:hypothetical protein n=1 Tax=unclassified Micromonospora TaxID=2617518 RepID=UPI003A87B7DB